MQQRHMSLPMQNSPPKVAVTAEEHSANGAKSIPIHCVIEQAPPANAHGDASSSAETNVELDTYAILPGSTLLSEIVRTALVKLGYNTTEALGAKGAVQIKNWKPLTFDTITDNPDATVEEMLCDLTSIATLRIRLCSRARINAVDEIKEKLLQFLLQTSESSLAISGCPIDKPILSQLSRGQLPEAPSSETQDAFNKWYTSHSAARPEHVSPKPEEAHHSEHSSLANSPEVTAKDGSQNHHLGLFSRSRIRTSFDPEHEIPRLHHWFQANQHPSREQMVLYLNELNMLESRRGRKPLDLTNIVYWFKNARAAQRRVSLASKSTNEEDMSIDTGLDNMDENVEEHLSPCPPDQVPVLPNKNAVYIVKDPMHHTMGSNSGSAQPSSSSGEEEKVVLPVKSDSPVVCIYPQDAEQQDEPEDLSAGSSKDKVSPRQNGLLGGTSEDSDGGHSLARSSSVDSRGYMDGGSTGDCKPITLGTGGEAGRLCLKREREDDNGYGSRNCTPSPKTLPFPTPPPPHVHPSAFNMAMPLNMHYMHHPAAALFMDTSPVLSGQFSNEGVSLDDRKKRSRVFIDPLSEIPKLEKWFLEDTHPSSYMIEKYTDDLNRSEYRQRFPKLEPKNVQLWFKNHRAKVKRARIEGPNGEHLMSPACDAGIGVE